MSGKTARQIRKDVKGTVDDAKGMLTVSILTYMEQRAMSLGFFKRFRLAMRYLFLKDIHSIIEA